MNQHEDEDRAVRNELFAGGYPEPTAEEWGAIAREAEELNEAYRLDDLERTRADAAFRQPAAALAFLVEAHGGEDCDGECPAPTEVLEVLSSNDQCAMRAIVRCADGTTRTVHAGIVYEHGSYDSPPNVDVWYEYIE